MPPNVHKLSNVIFQAQSYRFLIKWCHKAIEAMLLISFCHLKQISVGLVCDGAQIDPFIFVFPAGNGAADVQVICGDIQELSL